MKRSLVQKLGLLGVVSFLSYTAAVVVAPLAYPGYNWMAQAVSDLSAANAPSLALWNQLSALYNACEVVCCNRLQCCAWHSPVLYETKSDQGVSLYEHHPLCDRTNQPRRAEL